MLRLERLELHGFKSFHDRTEIHFDSGVTAVVGPNGCGKSNLLDAMTWVLGEQSIKSLRGSSSEDLIFNGTETRRPLGMAEVTLRLRALGEVNGGPESVAVTRRLFRSGESEYMLNGALCRLKDIQDLLYGSGLGVKAYSFMEQGKIGAVLQARPLDRRALIEEAAGITKFRAKKREAELKLEAAQQNLVRVRDIIAEVERQLGSLKRQASRARRYERVRDDLQGLLRALYLREAQALSGRQSEVATRHQSELERRGQLAAAVARTEEEVGRFRQAIDRHEAAAHESAERLHQAELDVDRNRNLIVGGRDRLDELERRGGELAEALAAARAREVELGAEIERRRRDHEVAEARQAQAGATVAARRQALATAAATEAASEAVLEEARGALLAAVAAAAEATNALAGRGRQLEQLHGRRERQAAEERRLEAELAHAQEATRAAAVRLQEADRAVVALATAVRAGFEQTAELVRSRDEARGRREEETRALELDAERARTLGRIIANAEDGGEAVAAAAAALGEEARGLVADHLRADPRAEAAVEAALESYLGALVVTDAGAACALLGAEGGERGALRLFLPGGVPPLPAVLPAALVAEPGVVGPLAGQVGLDEPVAAGLRPLLERVLLLEGLQDACRLHALYPDCLLVTRAGQVLAPGGLLRAGGGAGRGLLALRRESRELEEQLARRRPPLDALENTVQVLEGEAVAAEAGARQAVTQLHEAEKQLLGCRHRLAAADDEERKHVDMLRAARAEGVALDDEVAAGEREAAAERLALAAAETERSRLEAAIEAARLQLGAARGAAHDRGQELAAADTELARAEEACKAVAEVAAQLEAARQERADAIAALAEEGRSTRERMEAVGREVEAAEEVLTSLLAEVAAQRDRLQTEEEQARLLRHDLQSREGELRELRLEAESQRERLQAVEIERMRIEGELAHLGERCRDELGHDLAALAGADLPATEEAAARSALDAELGAEPVDEEGTEPLAVTTETAPLEELRARANHLRLQLGRLGPVNVLAIEEYQALRGRHEFLTSQANDLTQSIDSLIQTIARINRTSRERFLEAYEQVNRNFQEIFVQLFGGGRAELRLTDEENLLETGIDIVAQPPGKRLQNILLLSGGEKALTAISLLFALFRYKPSPFCILDEVDAPLDEKNIDRFLNLLRTLRTGTQFILITHSPRTMRVADTLYGVTMEEPGISRLVSVKLSTVAA